MIMSVLNCLPFFEVQYEFLFYVYDLITNVCWEDLGM